MIEVTTAYGCKMERTHKVSGDAAGSRDPQYNATLSCAASLTFKAWVATSPPLRAQSDESELDMLDSNAQTCKHNNSASEANSAVAVSCSPVPLVLEAACTDLLFS